MKRVSLTTRRRDGTHVCIHFPYDEPLIALVKQIPGRRWDAAARVWRCPLSSLSAVITVLEPQGFAIPEALRTMLPEAEAAQAQHTQRWEAEQQAAARLQQRLADGEDAAFVPASNRTLTRKLKQSGVYEVIREEGDYGPQVAGLWVYEPDLVETLRDVGGATEPDARLVDLLHYAWAVNAEAKATRNASRRYRYMKKGYLLDELCRLAAKQDRFTWGWKRDPSPPPNGAQWVLYFAREGRQCSFHTFERGDGPDFPGEWDAIAHQTFPFALYLTAGVLVFCAGKRTQTRHRPLRRQRH